MRTGRCQCGAVAYEVADGPETLFICHCLECRRQSGSAFGMSLEVARDALRLVRGRPRTFTRDTDSGGRLACAFCPDCGTRLWHAPAEETGDRLTVKAGTLDGPVDASAAVHIWTDRRMAGIEIPEDAERHPGEPPG